MIWLIVENSELRGIDVEAIFLTASKSLLENL